MSRGVRGRTCRSSCIQDNRSDRGRSAIHGSRQSPCRHRLRKHRPGTPVAHQPRQGTAGRRPRDFDLRGMACSGPSADPTTSSGCRSSIPAATRRTFRTAFCRVRHERDLRPGGAWAGGATGVSPRAAGGSAEHTTGCSYSEPPDHRKDQNIAHAYCSTPNTPGPDRHSVRGHYPQRP